VAQLFSFGSLREMTTTVSDVPAATCSWCGRENKDRLSHCTGCGTRLVSEPPPEVAESKGPRKALAVCLALAFGPLGLLYVKAWETAFVMILIAAPFVITHTGGLWITIGGRIICATLAYSLAVEGDEAPNLRRDTARLLDEAARLESIDRVKAIAAYEEIVRMYPNTSASKEAARNIETMQRLA